MNTTKLLDNDVADEHPAGTGNCLATGTRLNDFEITGVLGQGGFGIVYLAFDHSLQRTVAIKEYMPGALAGRAEDGSVVVHTGRHKPTFDAGLKSFINEARLLAQFDHPSLVKVYRFWEENKTAYMVMRHYDGVTLKEIAATRPELVTEAWLKFIFRQILDALDTLYHARILHRDVSPDNIIVQKNGDAVLLDFGSARQIIGDMTQGLTVILKPGYAPVEQYADDDDLRQGPWTDIYALAAVMYYMIIKSPPVMSVARVVKDTLVPLQQDPHPGFSTKFLSAVDQGLAIQPQDRPQTMDEFRRLLGISALASSRKSRKSSSQRKASESGRADASNPSSQKLTTTTRLGKPVTAGMIPGMLREKLQALRQSSTTRTGLTVIGGILILLAAGVYFASRHESVQPVSSTVPVAQQQAVASSVAVTASIPLASDMTRSPDPEAQAWEKLNSSDHSEPQAFSAFLQKYPNGKHAAAAQARLNELTQAAEQAKAQSVPAEPVISKVNVKLAVKPWGTVFVDGVQSGASPPLKNLSLTKGKHKIRITNPGFPDYLIEVDAGKNNASVIEHEFVAK